MPNFKYCYTFLVTILLFSGSLLSCSNPEKEAEKAQIQKQVDSLRAEIQSLQGSIDSLKTFKKEQTHEADSLDITEKKP